jgi:hypothetical protein
MSDKISLNDWKSTPFFTVIYLYATMSNWSYKVFEIEAIRSRIFFWVSFKPASLYFLYGWFWLAFAIAS